MKLTSIKTLLLLLILSFGTTSYAQVNPVINFQSIPSGPYGKGSSIAVLFKPEGLVPIGSSFNLYLSDQNGSFSNGNVAIGSVNAFYTTYINGLIPSNTVAGTAYKLKVEIVNATGTVLFTQTIPNLTLTIQNNFGTNGDSNGDFLVPTDAGGDAATYKKDNTLKYFGFPACGATINSNIFLSNKTPLSISWTSKNEFDFTTLFATDPFVRTATLAANTTVEINQFLKKAHYRFFQQATDPGNANTISTKAFYFINNSFTAPYSALANSVCYEANQARTFSFEITTDSTISGSGSINAFFNFPQSVYTANWDDGGISNTYNIRSLINSSGVINHDYSKSSCGESVVTGVGAGGTIYNSFGPGIRVDHIATCNAPAINNITTIQIFQKPKLDFTFPSPTACLNTAVTFTNTSDLGLQGTTTAPGCTAPNITFQWKVDGVNVATTTNFTISSLSVGTHTIVLSPVMANGVSLTCTPTSVAKTICIESIPPNTAKFALISNDNTNNSDTSFCPGNTAFNVINQSGTLTSNAFCNPLTYNWKLIGPSPFVTLTATASSASPNFQVPALTISGQYTLTLTISNPCGTSNAFTRIITVLIPPSITTQPVNRSICDGSATTFSAIAAGSNLTYQWQVSTDNGATFNNITNSGVYTDATTATLTLTGVTVSMTGYKYKLIVSGTCPPPAVSNIVTLTVNPRPTSVVTGSTTVCANTATQISIALTGTAPWSITYSDGTTPTTVTANTSPYTFNVTLGITKTYTITVLSDANCTANTGDKTGSAVITVNPLPTITGTLTACVGATTQLTGSATADATTPWSSATPGVATISNTGLVTGISGGTSVITYKNTNGCLITSTVTIYALPTVTIPTATQSLCKTPATPSGTLLTPSTTIGTGSSSLTYQWFSNANNVNTGGSLVATSTTYTPSNANTGETYYYLTVTNNNSCAATSNVSGIIKVYSQPTISALTNASYCKDVTASALNPTFNNGGYGTLTYQWYSNTTNSTTNAVSIPNETNATYTPPTNVVGTKYYYVIAQNGGPSSGSNCNTLTSSFAEIKVYATPTIPTDPISATYCATQTPAALTVPNATAGGNGTISYKWYTNTTATNSGGTAISNETGPTYTPPITVANTYYYYVTIGNGATGSAAACSSNNSGVATIIVNPLPVITSSNFVAQELCKDGTANVMTAAATTATGTITGYQWYKNTSATNIGGTSIANATNATFTPPTSATGTFYYYCEITNSFGCTTKTPVSGIINVYAAPVITVQPIAANYCKSNSATATLLSVTANTDAPGVLTYQWFSNVNNANTGGVSIPSATSATYRPLITTASATYYYVEVSNGGPAACVKTASSAVLINVYSSPIISVSPISANYCKDANASALSITDNNGGVGSLTYQWYSNTSAINTGGTTIPTATNATYSPPTNVVGNFYYYVINNNGGPASTCNSTSSAVATISVYAAPSIVTHPVSATYCKDNTVTPLTVGGAATGGLGTLAYQWFSNTTNSNIGGTQIANATTNSYTPLSTTPGTYYYYVEVRNGATGGASSCNTTASNVATFIVNPLPVINSQTTAAQDVCLNVTANQMSVTATTATGTITNYQWYKNTTASNSGGTSISNETNATFIPPTNLVGTSYYYCIVTNSFGCTTKSAVSGLINTFGTPVINTQPTGASYCQNVAATALSISATPGGLGTISYQWYSNTINANTGGVLLTNETNTTYTPPTNLVGTTYYYVVVNNGGAGGCNSLASNTAAIIVKDLPTINAYSLGAQTLCLNSVPTNLSITASTASGTITGYQWYFNTTNSITNATLIPSATNASYTPLTNTANTKYYFAIITNSLNCTTQSLISGNIIVNALPSITAQPSISAQSTCLNGSFTNLSVAASTGSGSISKYEWYSNTSNSTSGGTLVATHTISTSTDNYTPLATAVGTLYYYVIVYNTNGCTTTSNASAPIVVNDLPSFVVQPANTNQAVCLNTATTNLSVTASAGSGTIATYTWYQSATNAAIGNSAWTVAATHTSTATTDTYTPPNNTIGTMYYYVVVTNSNGCVKSSTASGSVTINPVPSITNQTTATCSGIAFGITLTNGGSLVIPNGTTYSWNAPTVTGGITGGTTGTAQTTLNGLLVNPTNTAQTATYTITPKTGNCDGATFTLIVTVNPKPTVNNKTIDACSGSNFALNFTHGTNGDIIPSNTTYSWAIPSVTGSMTGGASANNQTGLNGNITNVTNTQKIATYTLTPTAPLGSCGGDNFTVIVNINAKPSIPNKTATICSADAFTISPSNNGTEIVPSGTTYTWTVINNTSITGETDVNTASNNISQTLTNTSNTTQLVNYTVTPVSGDIGLCTGSTFPIVVTVNARPSISTKTVIACSNEAFTATITNAVNNDIVPSGTTYSWSIPIVTGNMTGGAAGTNALSVTGNLSNPTSVSQTATYTVTPTTPGTSCSGPSFTVTVTIKPKAIITAKSVTPCSTDAFTFILTDGANSDVIPAGSTYTWLAPTVTGGITGGAAGTAQSTISGTLTNPSNTTQTATYSITANSNGCTSTAFSATATVYAKPVITTQNVSTCSGTAFSVPLSNGGGIILPASTTFTWTVAQNNNVTGAINVTSSTSAIAQNLTNLTNTDQLVVYTVTPISGTTGACAGNPFTVNVTVKPKPSIAPQSEIICSGISFNNAPSNGNGSIVPSGITYTWSTPVSSPVSAVNGGTIQNTAQSSVSQNLNNTTNAPATLTYAVTPTAAGCAGSSYTLVVTVNPKPNITQSQSKTICSSETFTVTPVNATDGIVPTGTTYTWTVVDNPNVTGESTVTIGASSISQTLVNTSNTTQTVTYTVTPTSGDAGGCVGSTFTVTITVNPQPFVISQTQTICSGLSFGITPLQGGGNIVPANTKYTWSNPLSNPLGAISGGGAQAVSVTSIGQLLNNTTNTSATINYSVIPISSNNCSGPAFSVVVTVNPKPYIITQAQTICSENTFTVSPTDGGGSIVPTNTTYTWPSPVSNPLGAVSGGLSQISQASNISQLLTNTTNAAATLTYQITPKSGAAGSCDGAPFQLVVTVNAKPVVGPQTQTVCSGTLFNLLLTNSGSTIIPANTTYTWYVSTNNANISGQTNAVNGQSSISQTLTNNSNTVQQLIYTVTPKSGATGECTGSSFTLTVTVYPKPYVVNQSQTICSESAFNISPVNGSGLIVPASTTYTWGVPVSLPVGAITGGTAQSNASSVISQTLTNISNSQATLTYTVIPKSGTTGGCTGNSFNVVVTVSPKPILTSTLSPTAKCNSTNFIYDPISPTDGASWIWTRGIISGISNTSSTGTNGINETLINTTANPIDVPYSFALTTYGCPNTQTVTVRINPTPVLSSATSLTARCSGASVYYNPTSATVGTTYTWTRTSVAGISNPTVSGTGAISENLINTSANPITVTYNYTLTANGCTNPQTVTVTIDPLPISNFTIGGLRADCGPSIRTLINNSTVNGNALTNGTFTWGIEIIKNGSGVPLYNLINTNYTTPINYTFSNKGIIDSLYPIALTATSPNGCISTYRDTITIHPDAHLDVTVKTQAACAPFDAINATNIINITDPSPSPTINLFSSYTYTIRNRNNIVLSTTISPNPPNYQITNADDTLKIALKVNSLFGCKSDSVNKIVYTYQNPIVNFTVGNTTSCTMLSTQAVNTSYIGPNRNTSTLKYNWYANGSLISTIQNPLTFNLVNNSNINDSVYTLKLVISETTNGCKDSSSVGNLVVYPKPKAVFTIDKANQVCTTISGVTSSINNTSLFKTGTTPQYKWSVTYNNLFDTAKAIIIDSVTTPYFGAKPNFKFKDAQGTVDTSYNVNMMIYTVNGCIDTLSKSIKINRRPKVDFTVPIEGCGVYIINPVDNTTNFPNDSLQRIWNILPSGGVSLYNSTANNPYLILPINNTANSIAYKIKQIATSLNGCIDSLNRFTTIHPKPTASFTAGKLDSCGPWTKTMVNTSDPKNGLATSAVTSRWEVRKDNIIKYNTATQNLTFTFTNTGVVDSVYTVRLFISNPQGCLDTTALTQITVHPNAKAYFNTDTLGCAPFKIRDHIKVQDFPMANDIWRYEWRIYDRFGFLLNNYDSSVLAPNYIIENESDTVTLQLIAYSKWGCTQDIFSRQVITRANSVHALVSGDTTICSNLPLSLLNGSYYGNNNQTSGLSYQWYVNDSKVSNLTNPIFNFSNNSNTADSVLYLKLLTTYTNTGCNDSTTKKITIYPAPKPNFSITSKEICGVPVGYTDFIYETVVAKNNSYQLAWTITNQSINALSNLKVLPTSIAKKYSLQLKDNPGNIDTVYSIKLSATSVNNCVADSNLVLSLYRRPVVNFSLSNNQFCGESTIQLTDLTTNVPTNKVWSYVSVSGDPLIFVPSNIVTSPKILVPANTTGNTVSYFIKQIASSVNKCTDSTTMQLDVKPLPTVKFSMSDTSSCTDTITIKFTDQSIAKSPGKIASWNWNFGDGSTSTLQNPSHYYSKPGSYNITLVVTNDEGCASLTSIKTLVVHGSPKAVFSMSKLVCQTDSIRFTNLTTLGYATKTFTSDWDFGDGTIIDNAVNPVHVFSKSGRFVIKLKVKADSSCTISYYTDTITVAGFPKAGFTHQFNCVLSPVIFTDTSKVGYADTIGAWKWTFDDGSFSNQASPKHSFSTLNTFNVKLLISGLACPNLKDSVIYALKISAPIALFNMSDTTSCIDSVNVQFSDISTSYDKTKLVNWNWNFGDGTTSTVQSPTHWYRKPGKYVISLTVTNDEGCTSLVYTKTLLVHGSPKAVFSMSKLVCQTDSIRFTNLTTLGYATKTFTSDWDFGDGTNIDNAVNPIHVFTKSGRFVIKLKVKADSSCTISYYTDTITVAGFPKAGFTHQFNCVLSPVIFTDTSKVGYADTIGAWKWTFDDGSFSNQASPKHSFSTLNTFNVKLLISGLACPNLKDSIVYALKISAPIALFNMSDSTSCIDSVNVKFTDMSTSYDKTKLVNWNWSFGDGTNSTVQSPTHWYRKPGKYFITLTVTNDEGCTSLAYTKQIIIYGSPTASYIMPKQICLTDTIRFVNTSTLGYGSTKFISYTWDFGDGTPLDYTANPRHLFKYADKFIVKLWVKSDSSCTVTSFIDSVIVVGYPKANFTSTNFCVETPILYTDLSVAGYADRLGFWRWDFGDKVGSSQINPSHVYKNIGTYPVKLVVNGKQCPYLSDSITIPIKIIDRRRDSVYAIKYLQYNIDQQLCALPGGNSYTWSPSTDLKTNESRCNTITVQHPKTVYKINIIDSAGCTITDTQEIWGFPGTDIFLPRAFNPGSNIKENTILKPIYVGVTGIKSFKIYDRFGHEVFSGTDMSKYWDGTTNGVNQPMETYTWVIQGIDYNNKPVIRQGNVTLIRYQ